MDLTQIDKSIQAKQQELNGIHDQAQAEYNQASSLTGANDHDAADAHGRQAMKFDQQAQALNNELVQLQAQRQQVQQQVDALENERDTLNQTYESQLAALNSKISGLRGTGY